MRKPRAAERAGSLGRRATLAVRTASQWASCVRQQLGTVVATEAIIAQASVTDAHAVP